MEYGEGQRHVKDNSHESWANTHVESHDALLLIDLREAVHEAVVLVCVVALHFCLYYVYWIVRHRRAEASEGSRHQVNDHFVGNVV